MSKISENIKCCYYNRGFCSKRDNCNYIHPDQDCLENCLDSKCMYHHCVVCKSGNDCHYNGQGICEFKHIDGEKKEEKKKLKTKKTRN